MLLYYFFRCGAMTDDKVLVAEALNGDIRAFEEIVDIYKNKLYDRGG